LDRPLSGDRLSRALRLTLVLEIECFTGDYNVIWEVASLTIKTGLETEFEEGVAKAAPVFQNAKGCRSLKLHRSIEHRNNYRLIVGWDTVEDHMVHFRNSEGFAEWRKLVSHCFEAPPVVEHTSEVLIGF
jgi:heme-degrading monooxygenase HmoA